MKRLRAAMTGAPAEREELAPAIEKGVAKRLSDVGIFFTDKIQDGQICAFLFSGGLTNYKTHYGLSWFMPLL
jgi:hypothetical protein